MPRSALRDPVSGAQESITRGPFAEMTSPVPHNLGCFPTFLMKPNLTFSRRCSVLLYGPHGPILRPGVGCLPYNLHGKFQASGLKDAAVYRELVRSDSLLNYAHIFLLRSASTGGGSSFLNTSLARLEMRETTSTPRASGSASLLANSQTPRFAARPSPDRIASQVRILSAPHKCDEVDG